MASMTRNRRSAPHHIFALATACISISLGCDDGASPEAPLTPYYLSNHDLALELPPFGDAPPYRATVRRSFGSQDEERLLRIAESTYPNPESILRDLQPWYPELPPNPENEEIWWFESFDGVRIPYALTRASVAYYLRLTEAFRAGDFDSVGTFPMQSSSIEYTATINRRPDFVYEGHRFGDVYVVEMDLSWSDVCGNLCGLWFSKKRVVVLSLDGNLRAVFGDGVTSFMVS